MLLLLVQLDLFPTLFYIYFFHFKSPSPYILSAFSSCRSVSVVKSQRSLQSSFSSTGLIWYFILHAGYCISYKVPNVYVLQPYHILLYIVFVHPQINSLTFSRSNLRNIHLSFLQVSLILARVWFVLNACSWAAYSFPLSLFPSNPILRPIPYSFVRIFLHFSKRKKNVHSVDIVPHCVFSVLDLYYSKISISTINFSSSAKCINLFIAYHIVI